MLSELNINRGRAIDALKSVGKTYAEVAKVVGITRQRTEVVHKAFLK